MGEQHYNYRDPSDTIEFENAFHVCDFTIVDLWDEPPQVFALTRYKPILAAL